VRERLAALQEEMRKGRGASRSASAPALREAERAPQAKAQRGPPQESSAPPAGPRINPVDREGAGAISPARVGPYRGSSISGSPREPMIGNAATKNDRSLPSSQSLRRRGRGAVRSSLPRGFVLPRIGRKLESMPDPLISPENEPSLAISAAGTSGPLERLEFEDIRSWL